MSEEKKKPETWAEIRATFKAEINELLDQKLANLQKTVQSPQLADEMLDDPFKHVHECPTCSAKLEKEKEDYAKEFSQKLLKERKDKQYECEGCGLGVGKEEEKCPSCGGTKARIRRSI